MKAIFVRGLLAATALGAIPAAALAQSAPADEANVADIVVTARRAAEGIQNVPVTVQAISGATIQNQSITEFQEIRKLAPGLQLNFATGARGANAEVTLRGVRSTSASGNPAIPFYLNEVTLDPNFALLSLYDIGQLEVLRGPQGTSRGAPSISGAITVTTKRVNLDEVGGYAQALVGSHGHTNVQGAFNLPIIEGKLGVRVAAVSEESEGNRVRSLNNPLDPQSRTRSARATARWEPTDTLHFDAMYQYQRSHNRTYDQVAGTGSPGFTVVPSATSQAAGQPPRVLPANYNGPVIRPGDYLAVNNDRSDVTHTAKIWSWKASWDVAGHTVEYIGGYQKLRFFGPQSVDQYNTFIGYDTSQGIDARYKYFISELRIASQPSDNFLDYVVGAYYQRSKTDTDVTQTGAYLAGAFGAPNQTESPYVNATAANRYNLPVFVNASIKQRTYSFYGNITAHLTDTTELSGGLRWIHDNRPSTTTILRGTGVGAVASPACPAAAGLTPSPVYGTGFCDRVFVPAGVSGVSAYDETFTPLIYNVSLSQKVTNDVLAYATVGSSYRTGTGNVNVNLVSNQFRQTRPEKATSYELGVKTSWWDRRIRANAAIFQIDYKGQLTQFPNIPYRSIATNPVGQTVRTSSGFYYNVDARVRGLEGELAIDVMDGLTLGGTASYSVIKSKGGLIPCNNPAVPLTATNEMNLCPQTKGIVLNSSPKFNATANGEYSFPISSFDGYVRYNVAYFGKNPSYGFLRSTEAYTLVDLFAGVRAGDSGWDVQLYAKNAFNSKRILSNLLDLAPASNTTFGPTGYTTITMTRPREIGVQLRYAFGSR